MKIQVRARVHACLRRLILVGIMSISEVVKTMFADETASKQRTNSETVLRDFVVFTRGRGRSKYNRPNEQQTT